jgi:hypothetical protein
MADKAPLISTISTSTEAVAAGSDATVIVGKAPWAGVVSGVTYTPEANITGHSTESRTFTLVNKGQDGNGTTAVATLAMVATVDGVDFDDKTITLSATAANLVVAEGDVLAWTSVHVGATGLADPGGRVTVTITRS